MENKKEDNQESKEVSHQHRGSISDLFVFQCLQRGLRPSEICKQFSINKKSLQHHLSSLKRAKLIKKVGYGVWEILQDFSQKEVSQSPQVGRHQLKKMSDFLKPDSVRGHAFVFRYEVPQGLRNWARRGELLEKAGIKFNPLNIFGGGQQLIFEGRKVWLTDKSIVIYEQESFMAEKAKEAQSKAISHFLEILEGLGRYLQADFKLHRARFKVSRQHYALIKNALAKQYDREGKKLECVFPGEGLWFLIDNSFNLHEAETVGNKTPIKDNERVQDHFNKIKIGWADEIEKDISDLKGIAKHASQAQMDMAMWMQQVDGNMKEIIRRLSK